MEADPNYGPITIHPKSYLFFPTRTHMSNQQRKKSHSRARRAAGSSFTDRSLTTSTRRKKLVNFTTTWPKIKSSTIVSTFTTRDCYCSCKETATNPNKLSRP